MLQLVSFEQYWLMKFAHMENTNANELLDIVNLKHLRYLSL